MMTPTPTDPARTALLVEPQQLLVPFLTAALHAVGVHATVAPRPTASALRRANADVVILGMDMLRGRPLDVIRRTHRARPDARIVVLTRRNDPAWSALARAVGASVVLGPTADAAAFAAAVAGAPSARA
jgi:two-component system response regulator RegA